MATAAQQAKYSGYRARVSARLQEKGRESSFGVRGKSGPSWNPSGEYVETGKAFVFPLDETSDLMHDFSSDVRKTDLFFIVSNDVDIPSCNAMLEDGIEYSIFESKGFKPDNLDIFYEIQVRI